MPVLKTASVNIDMLFMIAYNNKQNDQSNDRNYFMLRGGKHQ